MPGSAGQAGRNTRDCSAPHFNRKSLDHPRRPSVVRPARRRGAPNDLADRLIMAGGLSRRVGLASADRGILGWGGSLERVDARN